MGRIGTIAVFAVLAALVAGCTNSPAGTSSSPVPSSPRSSSIAVATSTPPPPTRTGPLTTGPGVRPGEKPPILNTAAKQHTPAGALAFAEYYIKAFDWGIATTDPFLVKKISAQECGACRRYISELEDLRGKQGYVAGGRTTVISSKLVTGSFRTKSDYVVDIKIKEDPIVLMRPSAPPSTTAPGRDSTSLVFVSWTSGGWRIVEEGAPS